MLKAVSNSPAVFEAKESTDDHVVCVNVFTRVTAEVVTWVGKFGVDGSFEGRDSFKLGDISFGSICEGRTE